MDQPLIEAVNLVREYGARAVLDVPSLKIRRGDVLGVLGRNGSGKSTLLRLLCLLEPPSRGEVLYGGLRLATERERLAQRRRMAMVFQEPLLFSGTVRYNVSYGLAVRRMEPREVRRRVQGMLDLLGITHLADRNVDTLSGGEAQRVSLARALVTDPQVLFLDEPMANLDAPTRQSFKRDLARVIADLGVTAVYVTHDINEAMYLCNRVAVMSGGRIVQDSAPDVVWNRPATLDAAMLVGIENLVPGTVAGCRDGRSVVSMGSVRLISGIPAAEGAPVHVCVRPESIQCRPEDAADPPGEESSNRLTATVTDVEPVVTGHRVQLDCGFALTAHVQDREARALGLRRGLRLRVLIPACDVHLIPR